MWRKAAEEAETDEQLCQADFAPLGKGNLGAWGREESTAGGQVSEEGEVTSLYSYI